jgi:site-specific DNA-methyltransferase (adenine-specific)
VAEAWTLHLGDCLGEGGLATLADRSVGCVVMDPPYSERTHAALGREGRNDGMAVRDGLDFGYLTPEFAGRVAAEVARVSTRWIIAFADEVTFGFWMDAFDAHGIEYVRAGAWFKPDPMPQMSGDRPSAGFEKLVVGHARREAGRLRWNGGGRPAVYTCLVNNTRGGAVHDHPTQKPVPLMERLLCDFTDPGELVCDPFAGSGTTGVACIRLGRRFIGWEKDPGYYETARKRLGAARQQYELLPRGPKPRQSKLSLSDPEEAA